MKKFKDIRLAVKFSILFFSIGFFVLFQGILFFTYFQNLKLSNNQVFILNYSIEQSNKISLLSENMLTGDALYSKELTKTGTSIKTNALILDKGGSVNINSRLYKIKPLPGSFQARVDSLKVVADSIHNIIVDLDELPYLNQSSNQKAIRNYSRLLNNNLLDFNGICNSIIVDLDNRDQKAYRVILILLFVQAIICGILLIILVLLFKQGLLDKIKLLKEALSLLAVGRISNENVVLEATGDEIGDMNKYVNNLTNRLKETIEVIQDLGNKKFDSQYKLDSEGDEIGNSLMQVRDNMLNTAREEENRMIEDKHRNWIATGLNKFSDILRQSANDTNELSYNIISNLVKYMEANQGGIFLYNDEDESDIHLELVAFIAYDRQRYMKKKIAMGEGLLGACALEKETMYLSKIPDDYIEVESGLGDANPSSLLIVPLKEDDKIFGVIELASFKLLEKYEIEFVEQLAESIASTLSASKLNFKTASLLEQAREQAEELQSQEEEMRQNMEELQATQEESSRKADEMQGLLDAIDNSSGTLELDVDGYITSINSKLMNVLKLTKAQIIGRDIKPLIDAGFEDSKEYQSMWNKLKDGIPYAGEFKVNIETGEKWLDMALTPVVNNDGAVQKILVLCQDITPRKNHEAELNEKVNELNLKDEEMKQNLEELKAIQEELERKEAKQAKEIDRLQKENAQKIKDIKKNEKEREELLETIASKEFEYKARIQELEDTLKTENKTISRKPGKKQSPPKPQTKDQNFLFEWEPKYSVEIDSIDTQHKKLISIINRLYQAFKQKSAKEIIQEIIYDLVEYTRYHFSYEEKIFGEIKYKDAMEHGKEHKAFVEKMAGFQKDLDDGKATVTYEVMTFLGDWLVNHIMKIDKAYSADFKKNNIK